MIFGGFYQRRRVLVTGDSGFKGAWLVSWLRALGAEVSALSLAPAEPSLFTACELGAGMRRIEADLRDSRVAQCAIDEFAPEVVFHLAAQALVRASYDDPAGTVATNVLGTVNLLEAIRAARRPCVVVVCTSDKCYQNIETAHAYREDDSLGGHDPYSASKAAQEIIAASWRSSFFAPERLFEHGVALGTVRAGNVIGPGDWGRDRILADAARALAAGEPIRVRNPNSTRPWQHVLEPLSGYLWLGAQLARPDGGANAEAWNFGPAQESARPVRALVDAFIAAWGKGRWIDASSPDAPHEARELRLAIDKAVARLGWRPVWPFEVAVRRTAAGYRNLLGQKPAEAREGLLREIEAYVADARRLGVAWAPTSEHARAGVG